MPKQKKVRVKVWYDPDRFLYDKVVKTDAIGDVMVHDCTGKGVIVSASYGPAGDTFSHGKYDNSLSVHVKTQSLTVTENKTTGSVVLYFV